MLLHHKVAGVGEEFISVWNKSIFPLCEVEWQVLPFHFSDLSICIIKCVVHPFPVLYPDQGCQSSGERLSARRRELGYNSGLHFLNLRIVECCIFMFLQDLLFTALKYFKSSQTLFGIF